MKMFATAILSALLLLCSRGSFAQTDVPESSGYEKEERPTSPIKDRFFFGGSLGLQFGSATYIDVSPLVGYKITEKFHAGVGVTYIYFKVKDSNYNYAYETSIYGGRVFSRYYFLENFFGHAEFEVLNMDVPRSRSIGGNTPPFDYVRDNITSVMVGGGYAQPIGTNAALMLMILWNLTEEQYSPYQNPIFRLGFSAGF